jgi:hypothetical protein
MTDDSRSCRGRILPVLLGVCLVALPASGAGSLQNTATREFQKSLTLGEGQTLSLQNKYGDVHLHGGGSREVKISATIRVQAHTQAEADKFAEQTRIDVTQDSSGVKVQTVYPSEESSFFKIRIGGPSYSVDYDVTMPGDAKLWLRNSFGNVELAGVRGWTDVENGHGRLEFRDGGATKLTNSFGTVELNDSDGNATIVNSNGAVTVSAV